MIDAPDPVPGSVRQLVSVIAEVCPEVRFPDVDLETLQERSSRVEHHAERLAEVEQHRVEAREVLDTERRELLDHAQRALAYLRVFAEGRPELATALGGLELAKPERPPGKPKRGRPRKSGGSPAAPTSTSSTTLPFTKPARNDTSVQGAASDSLTPRSAG